MKTKVGFELKNAIAILIALVWSMGQLGQFFGGPKLFFLDGLLLGGLSLSIIFNKQKIAIKKDQSFLILWIAVMTSFLVNVFDKNQNQILIALAYIARLSTVFGFYFVAIKCDKKILNKGISLGLLSFLVLSIIGYLIFPDTRVIKLLGYDDHYFRAVGTLLDPNLSAVIYIWAFYWFLEFKKNWRILSLLALILLALSFSRSGYLAFGISLVITAIKIRDIKRIGWIFLLGLFIFVAPKPFGEGVNLARSYSIESRIENTKENLSLVPTKMVFGKGFNFISSETGTNKYINRSSGVDNSYLFLWMTTGLVGILALGNLILKNYRLIAKSNWASGAFAALLIHSLFNNSLFQLHIMFLSVICLGYLRVVFDEQ